MWAVGSGRAWERTVGRRLLGRVDRRGAVQGVDGRFSGKITSLALVLVSALRGRLQLLFGAERAVFYTSLLGFTYYGITCSAAPARRPSSTSIEAVSPLGSAPCRSLRIG